jgi:NADH-quinone oxidoreductase subunit D
MNLSVGPQHPGARQMRVIIVVDGDIIVNVDPDIGYVHRGKEKNVRISNLGTKCSAY